MELVSHTLKKSGLVCVVLHNALWAHVGDLWVALCRCSLNLVTFFVLINLLLATKLPFSFLHFLQYLYYTLEYLNGLFVSTKNWYR